MLLSPIGSSATTPTAVKAMLAGEVTPTDIVCPGFTMVPLVGEVICSAAGFCWAAESAAVQRIAKKNRAIRRSKSTAKRCFLVSVMVVLPSSLVTADLRLFGPRYRRGQREMPKTPGQLPLFDPSSRNLAASCPRLQ